MPSRVTFTFVPFLAMIILLEGCARERVFTAQSYAPAPNKATQPVPVNQEWWPKRHQAIIDRNKQGNVDLILIGDSITHCWEDYRAMEGIFRTASRREHGLLRRPHRACSLAFTAWGTGGDFAEGGHGDDRHQQFKRR